MQITRIILENFRQFKGKHEIILTPGFNLIQGPNGSGKSNILYAINFGLYKGVSKSMVASEDFISFGENFLSITIEFENHGKKFRIYRELDRDNKEKYKYEEWSSKAGDFISILTPKSSKTAVKEHVEQDTNIRQMVFDSIAFAQQKSYYQIVRGDKDFMDNALHVLPLTFLKSTVHDLIPRKADLAKSQALFTQCEERITQSQQAKEQNLSLKTGFETEEIQIQNEKAKLIEDNTSYNQLGTKVAKLGGDINKLIGYHNRSIHLREDIQKKELEKGDYILQNGDLAYLESERDTTQGALDSLETEIEALNKEIQDKKEESGHLSAELAEKEKIINNLQGLEGTPLCPVCRQEVTPEHLSSEIEKTKSEMAAKASEKDRHSAELQTLQKTLKDSNEKKTTLQKTLDDLKLKVEKVKTYDSLISGARTDIATADENYSALLATFTGPFNETLKVYNTLFNKTLKISKTPSLNFIDDSHKEMSNIIQQKQEEYAGNLKKLDDQLESLETKLNTITEGIATADQNICQAQQEIKDLKIGVLLEGKMNHLDEVLGNLIQEFREKKVAQLNQYTLEWYNRLISVPLFRDIRIDKENYRVYVLPLPNVVEKDDYKDVVKYASGGHETFIAIAERLALLEIFGTNFGMFDEITDNADRDNASSMILELAHSGEYLDQVIAVTHFEIGREVAGNIIRIHPILDQEGNPSGWSQVET